MKAFLIRWLITAAAVLAAVWLFPGIRCDGTAALLGTALLLGIINALILRFVGALVPGFHVAGFWSVFFGAILISFVPWMLSALFRGSDGRVHVVTHHGQMKQVQGRVIE